MSEYHPRGMMATGIGYNIQISGLVPLYEEHDARIAAGYTIPAWRKLGPMGRAMEVAHYRLRGGIKNREQEVEAAHIERENKKRRKH